MKSFMLPFLIASAAVGLVVGWQLKTLSDFERAESSDGEVGETSKQRSGMPAYTGGMMEAPRKSTDTAMTLHALPAKDLYDRMALFLLEAEVEEFSAYYEEFQKRSDRTDHLNELLFIAWTRVDPEAAIAASRGTDDFNYAYWAWAGHDPGAALAAAKERGEGVGNAVRGIGEFHPKWLSEHWSLIPEDQRKDAIAGLVKWPNTQTPEISLRLLCDSKSDLFSQDNEQTLLALARQDPAHAYEVIKELTKSSHRFQGLAGLDKFLASVSRHDPDLLEEIALTVKSPIDKNRVKLAQFQGLLRDDPASAKAMVDNTPASWLKEDLEVKYASHLLLADPDRGYNYSLNYLKNGIAEYQRHDEVKVEGRSQYSYHAIAGSTQLISNLVDQNAQDLLNELLPDTISENRYMMRQTAFDTASNYWVQQDVGAYADWLSEQKDNTPLYRTGVSKIVNILGQRGEFEAGIEWAQSVPDLENQLANKTRQLYFQWFRRDPEGAVAWRLSDNFKGDPKQFPVPKTIQPE